MEDVRDVVKEIKLVRREAKSLTRRTGEVTVAELEHMGARLQAAINVLNNLRATLHAIPTLPADSTAVDGLFETIRSSEMKMILLLETINEQMTAEESSQKYVADDLPTGAQGRPRKDIGIDQLECLMQLGFSMVTIASLLGVSVSTIKRRKSDYGLLSEREKTSVTDDELDKLVDVTLCRQPHCGIVMIQAELRRKGFWISRNRIRSSLIRIDPISTLARTKASTCRRVYKVAAPNSLWHIDSNLKLTVKFGIVIHGAIDGFSRKVLYLHAADNKKATTVEKCFREAVREYGWPSRIRTDKGGENELIGNLMVRKRSSIKKAHLVGSSVHNQRIERLWVDVRHCVSQIFIDLYEELVSLGDYDRSCEIDMFCARQSFIPSLNKRLEDFKSQWNGHSLSTEHQKTPDQLYIAGIMQRARSDLPETSDVLSRHDPFDVDESYGIDEGDIQTDADDESLVPMSSLVFSNEELGRVNEVLGMSSDHEMEFNLNRRGYYRLRSLLISIRNE
eukprot:Seg858.1 transcript_id=Seg858.1/GoldUCD/mRNA.D3Y31 product="hypothetical protein" protein_id=Seg858.1/GoldUCD/D3Y31